MKKYLIAAALALGFLFNTFSAKADVNANGAEQFVKNVTKDGIENIINANIPQKEKMPVLKNYLTMRLI